MSAPTSAAARDAAERGASKLDTVLYHFFAKTVAMVHESRTTPAGSAESRGRPNKWFSLELPEVESLRNDLRPWRALSTATCPPPLVVDVCLQTASVDEAYEVHARTSSGTRRLGSGDIVLERWRLDLQLQDAHHEERLPVMYKQAIVHFRTLFAMARLLPAARLARRLPMAHGASAQLALHIQVRTETPPLAMPSTTWAMAPIQTPLGALAFGIDYCDIHDIVLECRHARLPANASASMNAVPPSLSGSPAAASPLFQAMLAQDGAARRPLAMGRPRTNSLSTSPSLAASRFRRAPRPASLGGAPASPGLLTSTGMDALSSSALYAAEPGALRTLFASSARSHASPSLGRSVHTPPMHVGSFDTHMQGASPMGRTRLSESPHPDDAVPRSRPQRIERYSRQLSYRQRELSQSTGLADDGSARSWSQRSERRRQTDWTAAASPSYSRSLGGASPGPSRVFAGPSPSPAFALPRPSQSPSQHTPSSAEDVLDLVAMIDTRAPRAAAASAPAAPEACVPDARLSEHYYDDVLAKMTSSLRLLATDEALGLRTTDSGAEDEAAGRMEWSLNM
ncbi:autophagy protein 13 [Malassezia caprae]|uniref:Autophagy-related protein 13 n=1 Tax=Malassezia caprae TaxID=1381934 RepID=A0AAF0E4J1_9BASI|nr:autophagy protein 13 [Malassezia caprae]